MYDPSLVVCNPDQKCTELLHSTTDTDREASREYIQKHSLLAENLFSFLVFPDFFMQLSQMKLFIGEETNRSCSDHIMTC